MLSETADYQFEPGKIYNLEASQFIKQMDGMSGAHSDIDGPQVAHAIWQAALASITASATVPTAFEAVAVSSPVSASAPNVVLSKVDPLSEEEMPIPFGVQAETGQYLPPIKESDLDHIGEPSQLAQIRAQNAGSSHLAAIAEVQPDDLSLTGWGVIFSNSTPAELKRSIKDALKPLFDLRKSQSGDLFKIFDEQTGHRAGLGAEQWLTARGSSLQVVDPSQGVPYYLLLVGSPGDIPFEFQYDLDTYFAVGRISFDSPEEYARYANNIVEFEKSAGQQKNIAVYTARNDGDRATALLHDQIALPLTKGAGAMKPLGGAQGYSMTSCLADAATKDELLNLLRAKPAILFTGSHGVAFAPSDPQQKVKQGAILTQDWAGPGSSISPDTYFTANDVPADLNLNGMIHFFFACYSAGCPKNDTFSYGATNQPVQISQDTVVARLPQKLLLQGAQAVIGHIDRAWAYSFQSSSGQAMVQSLRDPLVRLVQGRRVADALDVFDQRWTVLSAGLLTLMQNRDALPGSVPAAVLANRWVARDDARNYIVLGDPAAKLKVS